MKTTTFLFTSALFGFANTLAAGPIPAGTRLDVRTDVRIDVRDADGRIYPGFVAHDVADRDGHVIIPRGATAELIVRRVSHHDLAIDVESVTVSGQRYSIDTSDAEHVHTKGEKKHVGAFAFGGALVGTMLGAVAGGGAGAAVGAVAGGAVGATTAIVTHGGKVYIPAESIMTFRLEQPLDIYPDPGYERDGNHYHRDWDHGNDPEQDPGRP
jgi:hypothetical protein